MCRKEILQVNNVNNSNRSINEYNILYSVHTTVLYIDKLAKLNAELNTVTLCGRTTAISEVSKHCEETRTVGPVELIQLRQRARLKHVSGQQVGLEEEHESHEK